MLAVEYVAHCTGRSFTETDKRFRIQYSASIIAESAFYGMRFKIN